MSRKILQSTSLLLLFSDFEGLYCILSGHLRSRRRTGRSYSVTSVIFSADGNELLVNMGSEHIYLFDILRQRQNRLFDIPPFLPPGERPSKFSKRRNRFCHFTFSFHFTVRILTDCESDALLVNSAYGTDPNDIKDYTAINLEILPDHVEKIKKEVRGTNSPRAGYRASNMPRSTKFLT